MVIGADGLLASVSVKTGSGHEVLDSHALEMFKRAKLLVPIPSALSEGVHSSSCGRSTA